MNTQLKIIRKEKGYTLGKIAQKSNVALRTYCYYETGKRVPDAHTAQRIAQALGSTVEDLFPLSKATIISIEKQQEVRK